MAKSPEEEAAPGAGGERLSIGRYLSSQRKLRGISLDELSSRTKIPRRNLERLESGAFDEQPDGFVRGFVRTVAAALGLDPQEAVMRLLGEPSAGDEEARRRRALRAASLAALAAGLLLFAVGWALHRASRWIAEPSVDPTLEHVYRRDAVRSLAERAARAPATRAQAPAIGGEAPAKGAGAAPEPNGS